MFYPLVIENLVLLNEILQIAHEWGLFLIFLCRVIMSLLRYTGLLVHAYRTV